MKARPPWVYGPDQDEAEAPGRDAGESVVVARCPKCTHALGSLLVAPEGLTVRTANKRLAATLRALSPSDRLEVLAALGLSDYVGTVTRYAKATFTCRSCGTIVDLDGPEGRSSSEWRIAFGYRPH